MFPTIKKATTTAVASLLGVGVATAALVPLDFSNITVTGGSSFVYSDLGDQWRASDVRGDSSMDAVFTITDTDDGLGNLLPTSTVFFDDVAARGNNMRVRVGGDPANRVADATVFITIDLFNAGTNDPYTGFTTSDDLITQFSDLDSDTTFDRTDFGGALTSEIDSQVLSDNITPGSSLLEFDTTSIPSYTIAHLEDPWSPKGNVVPTNEFAQSPVTAAFVRDAVTSLSVVVGQLSNGPTANRHIDIDMTPDFEIVPEPSSFALLAGIAGLGMALSARRRRS